MAEHMAGLTLKEYNLPNDMILALQMQLLDTYCGWTENRVERCVLLRIGENTYRQ